MTPAAPLLIASGIERRFGSGATLRIIASATKDDWPQAFPRFRAVRDGVGPK